MKLSLPEAAHRLRMTVSLLVWLGRYAAKRDGRKLQIVDGMVEEAELETFDQHMRTAWPNKNPGAGVLEELQRESRGRCGLCLNHTDPREAAHIDRFGVETSHHCQHPHNLILLCPTCHSRYDVTKTISNEAVKHAKKQLLSQLLEDVDRDIRMTVEIRAFCEREVRRTLAQAVTPLPLGLMQDVTTQAETVVTGSAGAPPASSHEAQRRLTALSGSISIQSPLTSRLLVKFGSSFGEGAPPPHVEIEDLVEDAPPREGYCLRCSSPTPIDRASCTECGEDAGHHEHATAVGDGTYELSDEDIRGDLHPVSCEECGSERFDVEFCSMCEYCEHQMDKLNDD